MIHLWFLATLVLPVLRTQSADPVPTADSGVDWTPANIEHLYNRAAFGATRAQVQAALDQGLEATLEDFFATKEAWPPPEPTLLRWEDFGQDHLQRLLPDSEFFAMGPEDRECRCGEGLTTDRDQFVTLGGQWMTSMIRRDDGLRDRMALFWHGFFTTSMEKNKRKFELIHQFHWLRRDALGSYAELLHQLVRDPAMLQYLDNSENLLGHPNENLARELMELYSLGEGNYSQRDVQEAARALTGNVCTSAGTFDFLEDSHDPGSKTILGVEGEHDAEDLVDILLDQEACPRWVARRLLRYFEGVEPEQERLAEYAAYLKEQEFALQPFLRHLFQDPSFYREEVRSSKVSAPMEYLVGVCHKLGAEPPAEFLHQACVYLGQAPYLPPSVAGWPEGFEWITADALQRRSNVVALLVGEARSPKQLRIALQGYRWQPSRDFLRSLQAVQSDADLAGWLLEEWLGVEASEEAHQALSEALVADRKVIEEIEPGAWKKVSPSTWRLSRAAHLVFSLPEAHLR